MLGLKSRFLTDAVTHLGKIKSFGKAAVSVDVVDQLKAGTKHIVTSFIPDASQIGLERFGTPEQLEAHKVYAERALAHLTDCSTAVCDMLNGCLNINDSAMLSFADLVAGKEAGFMTEETPLIQLFVEASKAAILALVRTGVLVQEPLAKFSAAATELANLEPEALANFLKNKTSVDIVVSDEVLDTSTAFVKNYRVLMGGVDAAPLPHASVDAVLWAPFLFKLKQWSGNVAHMIDDALEGQISEDTKTDGIKSLREHIVCAGAQFKTLNTIKEFAHAWKEVSEDIGPMLDIVTACAKASAADISNLSARARSFFSRVSGGVAVCLARLTDVCNADVEAIFKKHEHTGLPKSLKPTLMKIALSVPAKDLFKEMKWFYSEAVRDMRVLLEPFLACDVAASDPLVHRGGTVAGSLTVILAMWRPLKDQEKEQGREQLVKRCRLLVLNDMKKGIMFISDCVYEAGRLNVTYVDVVRACARACVIVQLHVCPGVFTCFCSCNMSGMRVLVEFV